jgi:cellulose synthase/poly-beta-1,6-N-acetylglucosamine synthase-like glycosyltransferase
MEILFWAAVGLLAYTYLLFPLLVLLRGLLFPQAYRAADITPSISLVIVAHNEAAAIEARLKNILELDYPREKLETIVASDGSTDATEAIVSRYSDRGIRLLALPRQGKIPALNAAVAAASGSILVFSDANSMYRPDALRALTRPLDDPTVGCVAGDQRYVSDPHGTNAGERSYWSFDRWLKRAQGRAGSATSATGAIYALRRSLFRPIPGGVTDDFAASTDSIAQGYRLVFASEAVAYEPAIERSRSEFGRKVRIMTRGMWGVVARRELLNPLRHGWYAWQLFSHKVLRRLMFIPLAALAVATPLLWSEGLIYRVALACQLAVYGGGIAGWLLAETRVGRWKPLALPFFFCLVNAASIWAAVNVLRGRRIERWEPERRDVQGETGGLSLVKPQQMGM